VPWDCVDASKMVITERFIRYCQNETIFEKLGYRPKLIIDPAPCKAYTFTNQNPNTVGFCIKRNRMVFRVFCEQDCKENRSDLFSNPKKML
jgi:poly(3-hydroxyalkanoate) synthetase